MRVVIADDHPLFRDGVASLLAARGIEVVGQAGDGVEAVEQALSLRPDVVLMDINMPELRGLDATRIIKAQAPDVAVVIVTVSDDEQDLFEAIKSGAQGYVLKNLRSEDFFELLEGVTRGEAAITRVLASKILSEFGRQEAKVPGEELTDRAQEVLGLVAEGKTNREIAEALYISENTVKFHTKNILSKLHLRSRAEVIAYAASRLGTSGPDASPRG